MKPTTAYKRMMSKGLRGNDVQNTTFGMASQSIKNKGGNTLDKTKSVPQTKPGVKSEIGPFIKGKGRQTKVYPQVAKGE